MSVDYSKTKQEEEFDQAVDSVSPEGKYQKPPLENLRKGVKIRQKENLNPINTLNTLAKTWDKQRQQRIDTGAQLVDTVVTGSLEKLNVPGSQFIGDRARNISGFAADMYYPESWELPFYAAAVGPALAEPTVFGESLIGLKYGSGVASRLYRAAKPIIKSPIKHLANMVDDVWAQGRQFVPNATGYGPFTGNWVPSYMMKSSDDLGEVVPGLVSRPLPGSKHVSGMVPQISGKFNGKVFNKTTLDPDLNIPWNLVSNPKEKGRQLAGAFVDQASDTKAWYKLNNSIKKQMEKLYPGWDIPLQKGRKPIGGFVGHHTAPVKQMAWSVNGLSNEAREEAANYMAKRIGQRLGFSPENLDVIPAEFHGYVHRMLNDAMGTYDVSKIEKAMGLKPGEFSKLELWERQKGFDMIADNIIQSKKDIKTFMKNLAIQSKNTDVSPEVLVDSMEDLLDLQNRIRLKPGDKSLNTIMNKFLGRSEDALKFVDDEIPAAERPIKNILYRLYLEDIEKAKEFARARRGTTPGNLGRTNYDIPDSKGLE